MQGWATNTDFTRMTAFDNMTRLNTVYNESVELNVASPSVCIFVEKVFCKFMVFFIGGGWMSLTLASVYIGDFPPIRSQQAEENPPQSTPLEGCQNFVFSLDGINLLLPHFSPCISIVHQTDIACCKLEEFHFA